MANNGGSFLAHIKDCPDINDNILTRGTGTYGLSLPSTSNTIYDYDQNGNTEYDLSRDLNIKYNYLNKPYEVSRGTDKIEWLYAADGTKLQKKVSVSGSSDLKNYYGEIERSGSEYSVYQSDSRYYESGDGASWQYKVSDHLGNTRVLYSDDNGDNQLEVLQSTHYYPFGMSMAGEWDHHGSTNNAYLYNDKEMNNDLGYDMVDYGARFYDPAIARWTSVDPLADAYSSISPYTYVLNNPLIYIDPDGMRVDPANLLNSDNQELIDAFNLFASSEAGIALLSKFAEKGQAIGGHTFESDGEFHSQGINLSFNAWEGNSEDSEGNPTSFGANGVTRTTETNDGGLEIGVFINSEVNSSSNPAAETDFTNSRMGTIFHETSIHADGNATDYTQDCQLNCSNIANHFGRDASLKRDRTIIQHKNAKRPGSTFNTKIVPAIISISQRNGSKLKSNEIKKRTLNFHN